MRPFEYPPPSLYLIRILPGAIATLPCGEQSDMILSAPDVPGQHKKTYICQLVPAIAHCLMFITLDL